MKKAILIVIGLLFTIIISAQDIEGFVNRQLEIYPKSRLLDIYKSSFQDYMGAEHLISDRQRVKAYLDEELQTTSLNDLMPWYFESCGVNGQYIRVSIRAIKENKQGTLHMVKSLNLVDLSPLDKEAMPLIFTKIQL